MDDDDVNKLPLEQRIVHSKWSARQSAYKELAEAFDAASPGDAVLVANKSHLKKAVTDANVVALESGIRLLAAWVRASDPQEVDSVRGSCLGPMAEKAVAAVKPSVKTTFTECCEDIAENSAKPGAVVEDILPCLALKSPKAVVAALNTLIALYTDFGKALAPQPVLKQLPGLFGVADKNIRNGASDLATILASICGKQAVLGSLTALKPVQVKELEKRFESVQYTAPTRIPKIMRKDEVDQEDAVEESVEEEKEMDPFDLAEPVDVLKKIPDQRELLGSTKWKERKEALETIESAVDTPRIANGDFSELVSSLNKVIAKDANIMCATSAMNSVRHLALGLRGDFSRYVPNLLPVVSERFKEKKPSVTDAATAAMDAMYRCTSFEQILPSILGTLAHKAPQARIIGSQFMLSILTTMPKPPTSDEVKQITPQALKNMTDTQEPVRAGAAKILAALTKLVGERAMTPALSTLDDIRRQKVTDVAETIEVKAKAAKAPAAKVAPKMKPSAVSTKSQTRPTQAKAPSQPAAHAVTKAPNTAATPRRAGVRSLQNTDFTPAKQTAPPARRRLESPKPRVRTPILEPDSPPPPIIQSPSLIREAPPNILPSKNHAHGQTASSPMGSIESDMLRREKLLILREKEMLQQQLSQERILRETAERQVRSLRDEVEALKREMNHMRNNSPNTSRGDNSMDGLNIRMSGMQLQDESDAHRRASRIINFGPPRRTSMSPQTSSPEEEPRRSSYIQQERKQKSQENWRRAAEVTSALRKRIEDMKRSREDGGN